MKLTKKSGPDLIRATFADLKTELVVAAAVTAASAVRTAATSTAVRATTTAAAVRCAAT